MNSVLPKSVTEGEVCGALNSYFIGNCRYKLANAFIFKADWESDFLFRSKTVIVTSLKLK